MFVRNEARFLVQRIPAELAIDPQLSNAAALLRGLYSRSYRSIYAALNSPSWCTTVMPLRDRCLEDFRHRTFWLLSRAYTSIAPSAVAFYLGLDAATGAVVDKLQSEGWDYDATTGLLKPFVRSGKQTTSRYEDDRIGRLTALVTHLTEG
jgi:COP9 signalosome complex subunit 8